MNILLDSMKANYKEKDDYITKGDVYKEFKGEL